MMDIRVKAALRLGAVFGWAFVGVVIFYLMTLFLSDAMILGIIVGSMVVTLTTILYRIFLDIEKSKERNNK
jgi:hypothetical protein